LSCLKLIEQYYDSFTASEKKIADYVIKHTEKTLDLSIHQLASAAGVAPSSVTRFVHRLEYKSFTDMRIDLVRSLDSNSINDFSQAVLMGSDERMFSVDYIQSIASVCSETLNINKMDKIIEAAHMIKKAKNIFLFGVGASSIVAQDIQQKLTRLYKRCLYNPDGNQAVQHAVLAGKQDLVIAVSYGGITREVNLAVREASKNGCKTIAITRYARTTLSDIAHLKLYVPNVEEVNKVAAMLSRYAEFLLVDAVFLNTAHIMGKDPAKIQSDSRSLLSQLREEV
jgi:DNA-binding MurR/RpiR family transcriptional regulator